MVDQPENLTLRLLQEMREELRAMREAQNETNEQIADLVKRIDGNTLSSTWWLASCMITRAAS